MSKQIRRLIIVTLMAICFAFTFTAIVQSKPDKIARYHPGTTVPCLHYASPYCASVD